MIFEVGFRQNKIWPHHVTSGHQNRRLRGAGGGKPPALGDFWKFVTKIMHFRHISAKFQAKNLKHHFDWGARPPAGAPIVYALAFFGLIFK